MTIKRLTRATLVGTMLAALATGGLLADYDSAMSLFKQGKYAEAAAEFQTLVDQSPGYDYGYFMLGLSFLRMDKNAEAATNIQKALELNGDKFPYHHALASVYRSQGQKTKALSLLNDAEGLVTDSTAYQFYSLRGFINIDLDHWSDAIDDLEKVRAAKDSPQVEEALGTAYFKLGYYDKALPRLQAAAKLAPNDTSTQMLLAESLINLGREATDDAKEARYYGDALQAATRYRSLKPDDVMADNLVGRAALGAEDFGVAAEAFRKVIAAKPDYCYAQVNLTKCLIATEDWTAAEKTARHAVRCAPKLTAGYESLGYALQKQGRLDEALTTYNQAYGMKPSPGIQALINVVERNMQILRENAAMDAEEAAAMAAAEEEARRIAEEEAKIEEWKKKQDD